MKFHLRLRRISTAALVVAACTALAAPAGADPVAGYPPSAHEKIFGAQTPKVGDTPADYPGMPGTSVSTPAGTPEGGGFDWPSAAIGAGGAGLLIVLSVGGAMFVSRHRVRVAR
jgi:hypothetical protein